jgi:hypothetical protein
VLYHFQLFQLENIPASAPKVNPQTHRSKSKENLISHRENTFKNLVFCINQISSKIQEQFMQGHNIPIIYKNA